jgi:hypothetical protein
VYRVDEFETLFKRSLSDITSEAYARLLAALLEALEVSGEKQDARVAAEIHACYLAIDLQIPSKTWCEDPRFATYLMASAMTSLRYR